MGEGVFVRTDKLSIRAVHKVTYNITSPTNCMQYGGLVKLDFRKKRVAGAKHVRASLQPDAARDSNECREQMRPLRHISGTAAVSSILSPL